jgi:hypothetical protein
MMQSPAFEAVIFNAAAAANVASALIVLYFMQVVTASSGIGSWIALLQGVQRALYVALTCALAVNAAHIYNARELPGFYDGFVEASLFALCVVSFLRHRSAPPVPKDATWEFPPAAIQYGPRPPRTAQWSNGHMEASPPG